MTSEFRSWTENIAMVNDNYAEEAWRSRMTLVFLQIILLEYLFCLDTVTKIIRAKQPRFRTLGLDKKKRLFL